jgi:hypothetical protein
LISNKKNLCESREVCKGGSQEVQDGWLCKSEYTLVECGVKISKNNEARSSVYQRYCWFWLILWLF